MLLNSLLQVLFMTPEIRSSFISLTPEELGLKFAEDTRFNIGDDSIFHKTEELLSQANDLLNAQPDSVAQIEPEAPSQNKQSETTSASVTSTQAPQVMHSSASITG